jgi:4-alpha-glucanotransferase
VDVALIETLARLRGIGDAYHDYRGELKHFSIETKIGILRAMGCPVDDSAAIAALIAQSEQTRAKRLLPEFVAVRGSRASIELNIAAHDFGAAVVWSINFEDGTIQQGSVSSTQCPEVWRGEAFGSWITRRRFDVPAELPLGYHSLEIRMGSQQSRCSLISAPSQCFEPEGVAAGERLWGVAVQVYTLRSRENWGIGDFQDLQTLIRWIAPRGAGFVGVNPLHALSPADPGRASPYSASSRNFFNVLYIAVHAIPEFAQCASVQQHFGSERTQERLGILRAVERVDYPGVAELKFEFLELLYRDFRENHLAARTERAVAFETFVATGGALLQQQARFDALDRHLGRTRQCSPGWQNWPEEYRDVSGAAVAGFAAEHAEQVEFFSYLQWLAQDQLAAAQGLARELGMRVGLYGDYAVGADPSGAETWANPTSYALGAEIGAPPDPLALKGQGWGIPPQDPAAILADRLDGFVKLLRNNMRAYGALRLDHVMSLFRLWWVPGRLSPTDGAYVHYPLHQLLTVLALESVRASCLVVGEDLGVVPDEMRHAMPEFGLYHYKVLLFEKLDGRFRRPEEFTRRALATVTTHDMPTLKSYWEGRDIELRRGLNLYPTPQLEAEIAAERTRDREWLLTALREQGLSPERPAEISDPFTPELAQALHMYLARSASVLVAVQIEDLLGMIDPVNVPGTHEEYPNWKRKVSADIEDIAQRPELTRYLDEIHAARLSPRP